MKKRGRQALSNNGLTKGGVSQSPLCLYLNPPYACISIPPMPVSQSPSLPYSVMILIPIFTQLPNNRPLTWQTDGKGDGKGVNTHTKSGYPFPIPLSNLILYQPPGKSWKTRLSYLPTFQHCPFRAGSGLN